MSISPRLALVASMTAVLLAWGAVPVLAQDTGDDEATYTVQAGDTLFGIAQRFGTSVRSLKKWNDLDGAGIQVGQTLRVRPLSPSSSQGEPDADAGGGEEPPERPSADAEDAAETERDTIKAPGRIIADAGDTLVDIALRLGTTADTLFALNDSIRSPIEEGQGVLVPSRFGAGSHVVQPGETLYSIAGAYGVSVRALQSENDLEDATINPGQRLDIPGNTSRGKIEPPEPDSTGPVAVYPTAFEGRLTASGETYDPATFTGSHPTLPYGSIVLLSHPGNRRHSFLRIIDRGPVEDNVIMDVSKAVAQHLGFTASDSPDDLQLRIVWVNETRR
ncbi:LysM peptidoglycan-binding domain-containing protein [Longibacter salinarum]|uniref:LysM peptidoglycan-binding domain-containing protein n=1 Tax=Longibacter salinarum TaxID=1850348 RepID=UPI0015CF4F83|nr:LysM peptidoglycan-binding domain-containing protein [Longibacter salinarum]